MNKTPRNKIRKLFEILKQYKHYYIVFISLAIFFYIVYKYYVKYFYIFKDPNKVKEAIIAYGSYSVLIFIALQIVQVIVFFIPGEVIQIAGGYIYGTLNGSILSLIGITLGSAAIFFLANRYGKPFVEKIISGKKVKYFKKILKLGSTNYVVFLLYLIPGVPKDILGYICGICNISFKNFILYSTIGRVPGIILSTYFGHNISSKNTTILIVIGIFITIISIIGILKGEKIVKNLTKNKKK